ncbi:MAG: NAD(P)/FAD-dependent oxidoreductase [Myxococcota bacterium]
MGEAFDVAIVGGGPAGLEAALVLVRAGRRVVVFDDPAPPRNGASHGVHNFLGFEGLEPEAVREKAWGEISRYEGATAKAEKVTQVSRQASEGYSVRTEGGNEVRVPRLILAFGFRDVFPDIEGFTECWADTVIPCPFCDGYENRDRVWGVVPRNQAELAIQPRLALHWASEVHLFLRPHLVLEEGDQRDLDASGIVTHLGVITALDHAGGKLHAATLDTGKTQPVETLLWVPEQIPTALADQMADELSLALTEEGFIQTDDSFSTNLPGVWAVGDVKGWTGGLSAAAAGYVAAVALLKSTA